MVNFFQDDTSGAARKLQITNYLTEIRVGKTTTPKMPKAVIISDLRVAPGVRHGPRRIAKHPELSGLLPLSACKGMSSELRLLCLDDLRGRDAYDEKRDASDEKRDASDEKRDDYDEKRDAYDEKRKIDRKDYQIFLGFYRNNDYIVNGKRFTRLCLHGFAKHESYILYKRN